MAKEIKLEVIKYVYDDETQTKEIWTTRVFDTDSIKKLWKLANKCVLDESEVY